MLGLTGPAYVWLALTIFLPLSAMLFFSFLTVAPLSGRHADVTLQNYSDYFTKGFYLTLTGRSLMLGVYVTALCVLLGYPAALALAWTGPEALPSATELEQPSQWLARIRAAPAPPASAASGGQAA